MKLRWRQLRRGEINHELLWLSVSAATFSVALCWLRFGWPLPRCAFLELTGFPCPTCGVTRCAKQFFHAHFVAALSWNPLAFCALVGVVIFDVYALAVLLGRLPRLRFEFAFTRFPPAFRLCAMALIALNWLYEMHRLS